MRCETVKLARQADGEVADIDHFLHFAQAFLHDLARFERHQPSERGLLLAQFLAEQTHEFAAPLRKGGADAGERSIDIGGVCCFTRPITAPEIGNLTVMSPASARCAMPRSEKIDLASTMESLSVPNVNAGVVAQFS